MINIVESAVKRGTLKGLEQGREAGKKENAIKVAKAMIEDQLPMVQIVKYSGLTREEIEKLKSEPSNK